MDSDALGPERAALQRAKLHIRGGRRRLRQGRISAGIVTLSDALAYAMQWYVLSPWRREALKVEEEEKLFDDKTAYRVLVRSGVLDGSFDYLEFDRLVDRALAEEIEGFDYGGTLRGVEKVMEQLGVMPFDESELPPEDPSTF
jgi:predicted DNA-binding protein (UPF0278 family)